MPPVQAPKCCKRVKIATIAMAAGNICKRIMVIKPFLRPQKWKREKA